MPAHIVRLLKVDGKTYDITASGTIVDGEDD